MKFLIRVAYETMTGFTVFDIGSTAFDTYSCNLCAKYLVTQNKQSHNVCVFSVIWF